MWHFYAGSYRVASKWAEQEGMFTYHPTLANQNNTDVVFGERDHGGHTRVYQQFGYSAYGEVLNKRTASHALDTRSAKDAKDPSAGPAWRFDGKELDESTGLTYFGARYYDSRTALWLSTDPAFAGYLSGKHAGGAYNPRNLAQYIFGWSNPISFKDNRGWTAVPAAGSVVEAGEVVISVGGAVTGALGLLIFGPGVTVNLGVAMDINIDTLAIAVKGQATFGLGVGAYLGVGGSGGVSISKPDGSLAKLGYGVIGGSNTEYGGNAGFGPSGGLAVNVSDSEVGVSPSPTLLSAVAEKALGREGVGFGAHGYVGKQFSGGVAISPVRIWQRIVRTHEQLMDPNNMQPLEIRMGD